MQLLNGVVFSGFGQILPDGQDRQLNLSVDG